MRRACAAACAAVLWIASGGAAGAAEGEPAAGGVHLIPALEKGPGAAVLVLDAPRQLDGEAWLAEGTVERSFYGGATGERIPVAWEERARQRPVRFGAGDRVLVALEPLPGYSIWLQRIPDGEKRASTLTIAQDGDAFLRNPSLGGLLVLQHYLALPADRRETPMGVGYLVELAAGAEPALALAAVERLAAMPQLDVSLDESSAKGLVAALLRADAPPELTDALLALVRSAALQKLRPPLEGLAQRDALAPAVVYEALGRIDDALPSALCERLLAARDSAPLRAAGARFATGPAVERLPRLVRSDAAPEVRKAAALRWLAQKGVGGGPELRPALLDSDRDVRMAVMLALAQEGPTAVPALQDVLSAATPEITRELVAALSLAGGPQAQSLLRELAETHPDESVRQLAGVAIGRPLGHRD
ncbi:MAG TPA: HEAT repeat domain-containing protein [Myxococcota bacterium]|nr:HEAT repeat domain-containing protein [Myxococcota bacterium]